MAMVLGTAGSDLVKQMAGQVAGTAPGRNQFWGEMVTKSLPRTIVGPIADRVKRTFMKKFAVAQGTNVVGRLIPFGIGAVIGGGGNHLLGRQIVRASREGFGPAPVTFPAWLEPRGKEPKAPKTPKAVREPRERRELRVPLPVIRMPRKRPRALETPQADAVGE